jgi:hypothetical protein
MKILTVTLFICALCMSPVKANGCRFHLSDHVGDVNIEANSGLEALLRFGLATGVCLGVETPDIAFLKRAVQLHASRPAVAYVIQSLLGTSRFQVSEREGVILLKGIETTEPDSQLDVALSEFQLQRVTVAWASLSLFAKLMLLANPSIHGFAGHLSDRVPDDQVGPFEEHGRTVRDLLTLIVGRSAGGAWVSGRCAGPAQSANGPCWTILQYRDQPDIAASVIADIVRRLTSEQESTKKEVSK